MTDKIKKCVRTIEIKARIGESHLSVIKKLYSEYNFEGQTVTVEDIAGELIDLACRVIKLKGLIDE